MERTGVRQKRSGWGSVRWLDEKESLLPDIRHNAGCRSPDSAGRADAKAVHNTLHRVCTNPGQSFSFAQHLHKHLALHRICTDILAA